MKYPHTPGPWIVESGAVYTEHEYKCSIPGCGVHIPIANMDREHGNGTTPVERDSNARLIGAAPDLFKVASRCLGYFNYMGAQGSDFTPDAAWLKPLIDAINKAQGEM